MIAGVRTSVAFTTKGTVGLPERTKILRVASVWEKRALSPRGPGEQGWVHPQEPPVREQRE